MSTRLLDIIIGLWTNVFLLAALVSAASSAASAAAAAKRLL